jgi:hypothetical protein
MTTAGVVVAIVGWGAGRPWQESVAIVAAFVAPIPMAMAIALLAAAAARSARAERPGRSRAVLLMVRLSADLHAGHSLRTAIIELARTEVGLAGAGRLAEAGRPIAELTPELAGAFGRYGGLVGAAVRMASAAGGPIAAVVDELVVQAMALDDLERERRAAMAPALIQAAVVGGVPLVILVGAIAGGRLLELVATGPVHAVTALGGSVLVLGGVAWVAVIVWRARS